MTISTILLLCLAAFAAGFVDAFVGGGGLIQTPASLVLLPSLPVAQVIGSLKIPAFSGTSFAAYQYAKQVKFNWKLLGTMMVIAFLSSFIGSYCLTIVHNDFIKPILLIVLFIVALYTYSKKNFGQTVAKHFSIQKEMMLSICISISVGFYDGFIGPGTGSFLVLLFISILGYDFLQASANAKMVNLATNFGSIILFLLKGAIIWNIAVPMAISNAIGGLLGAKLAIRKGNKFIRVFFMMVVMATLIRFAYDVFFK